MVMAPFLGKDSRWHVDFRGKEFGGLGQHTLQGIAGRPEAMPDAINAAWALWLRLQKEAEEKARALALSSAGGVTFAHALDALLALRREREAERWRLRPKSLDYVEQYFGHVRAELGARKVIDFAPPAGSDLLAEYVAELAKSYAPPSRANRLSVVRQVLSYAWDRGWMTRLPRIPRPNLPGEPMRVPKWRWLTEADFRVLYDRLWDDHDEIPNHGLRSLVFPDGRTGRDAAARRDYIARRKLYLSWAFYTGSHTVDCDNLTDERLSAFFPHFTRRNSKSSVAVPEKRMLAPEQLFLDRRKCADSGVSGMRESWSRAASGPPSRACSKKRRSAWGSRARSTSASSGAPPPTTSASWDGLSATSPSTWATSTKR
jgi:hypothetical protein